MDATFAVGHQNDTDAEILGGVTTADTVIVYPGESVDDGVAVIAAWSGR